MEEIIFELNQYKAAPLQHNETVVIKPLTARDFSEVAALQQLVFDELENNQLYSLVDDSFLIKNLSEHGITLGAFHKGKLIAYSIMYFPELEPDNLGLDIGIPTEELSQVAQLQVQIVHADYRGNHLQVELNTVLIAEAKRQGYHYITVTVSPDNTISLRNLQSSGLSIVDTKLKYGGKMRHIMMMEL